MLNVKILKSVKHQTLSEETSKKNVKNLVQERAADSTKNLLITTKSPSQIKSNFFKRNSSLFEQEGL